MNVAYKTDVLVSPTALALSMLHAGGRRRRITIARSRLDFMRLALTDSPSVAVVGRGWLRELDLRRLALRRVFSSSPKLVLVLARGEVPTLFERKYFDDVIVAAEVFEYGAARLQAMIGRLPPPPPCRLAA
jgi:hypothetical protein